MQHSQIAVLVSLTIFGSLCQPAPATSPRQYGLGTTYTYSYSSIVLLNEPPPLSSGVASNRSAGADVGYQIAATVDLTSVWQDESDPRHTVLEMVMKSPKLSIRSQKAASADGFLPHSSPLDSESKAATVYLDWNDGKILRIFSSSSESPSFLNLKKGLASLFQLHNAKGEFQEVDASGRCNVKYEQREEATLLKKKTGCNLLSSLPVESQFSRSEKILGVSWKTENQWKYNLKKDMDIVEHLTATEVHSMRVALRRQAGASVISRQYLHLSSESQTENRLIGSSVEEAIKSAASEMQLVESSLQVVEENLKCQGSSCRSFAKAVNDLRKDLQASKLASSQAADAFVKLIPVVRRSTATDILAVLKDVKNKKIIAQLLDVVAAAQTQDSHQAAVKVLNFKSKTDIELAERYLVAVSLSTHPSEYLVEDLLALCQKKIPNANLALSATLSLASITQRFRYQNPGDNTIVSNVRQHLLDSLQACKDEECNQLYLRALKNLAMSDTVTHILERIDSSDRKTSVVAVKALQALPADVFQPSVLNKLQKIYFEIDRRYDSSARTLALDILLDHQPQRQLIYDILRSIASNKNKELVTYTVQRLLEYAGNKPSIRAQLKEILIDEPSINNYHFWAQNGQSTAFTRLMYHDLNGNGTFSSSNEVVSGVMKRSSFDIYLNNEEESFHLLSFGLFTGGLTSFMGGSSDDEDTEDATAGMEITLSSILLRPLVFFSGQGELMGHVWSGTASERTSALQATVLLQDHRQSLALQSGFVVVLDVLGAVSFDFGGEIQISIWNRNSHSVVDNMAAWHLGGLLSLSTPFINSDVEFQVSAEAKVDFVSDVSFGDGLLACLRMGQNGFKISHTVEKRESIPETKHWIHKRRARQEAIPGRTYVLNQKNSLLCNQMFPQ